MGKEKIKYADRIAAAKRKWEESTPEFKEAFHAGILRGVVGFLLWWDTLKAIEEKFNIDVMGIARKMRWKSAFEMGQRMAKKYNEPGIKELYDAYPGQFEGVCEPKFFEFNDEVFHVWLHHCPVVQNFKDLGRTDEEIKEMAPLYCLADEAIMAGFNPDSEVYAQPRLLMRGDSHCTYRVENHKGRR